MLNLAVCRVKCCGSPKLRIFFTRAARKKIAEHSPFPHISCTAGGSSAMELIQWMSNKTKLKRKERKQQAGARRADACGRLIWRAAGKISTISERDGSGTSLRGALVHSNKFIVNRWLTSVSGAAGTLCPLLSTHVRQMALFFSVFTRGSRSCQKQDAPSQQRRN